MIHELIVRQKIIAAQNLAYKLLVLLYNMQFQSLFIYIIYENFWIVEIYSLAYSCISFCIVNILDQIVSIIHFLARYIFGELRASRMLWRFEASLKCILQPAGRACKAGLPACLVGGKSLNTFSSFNGISDKLSKSN
jgi:hypothetical protein